MANGQDKAPQQEAYYDKYGIPKITLGEFSWNLELTIKQNQKRGVLCAISEAGVGKSQIVHQLARKYKMRVVDIRTSQFSLIGAGVPQRADDTGHFKIAVPEDYPKKGEKCIVLFDEINQGQSHAIAMFFKLLEDRGIYNYELPDECIIVALMNPSTAQYNVSKIETNPAINRRLMKCYVYATFTDWLQHAKTDEFHHTDGMAKPCHPWVLKFLQTEPKLLYRDADRDGNKQFACPATWQTVSLSLYNLEAAGEPITSERAENRLSMSINPTLARSVVEYVRNNEVRISPDEILFKYKAKSKLRERVLSLKEEPGGEYPKLIETVAHFLFNERPKPVEIANQLALFWHDMPDELAQAFFSMLGSASESGDPERQNSNRQYMKVLTNELQTDKLWLEINHRLMKSHNDFERALKGGKAAPDPMPKR
jgi:hypothetical protein